MAATAHGSDEAAGRRPAPGRPAYRERLYVPWTWWALGFGAATLLTLEVTTTLRLGHLWVGWQVATAVGVGGMLASGLISWSLVTVEVVDGELVAGPARLPVRFVGELRLVDERARRALMGPQANPRAYVHVRAWVRTAVLVEVTDPDDPTPYWLVSTRHPARLAAALGR